MNHFRNAYQTFLEKIIQCNNRAIHLADLKAVLSLVMGTAFISIGLALAGSVDQIVAEIIYSIGSFGMWAAIAAFIETIPTLRARKKRLELFSRAQIVYRKIKPLPRDEREYCVSGVLICSATLFSG